MYKCHYFKIEELVHPDFLYSLGEDLCWKMFPEIVKYNLDRLRHDYGKSITINDYLFGGKKVDSGVRRRMDNKYAHRSTHKDWTTFDLRDGDGNTKELQDFIEIYFEHYNIERIENFEHTKTWVHIQFGTEKTKDTYWFNP